MSLRTWITEYKLGRVEANLKRLHVRQRQIRDKLSSLETEKRRRGLAAEKYEARKAALEKEKHDVTERVNALVAEEAALKGALRSLQPTA